MTSPTPHNNSNRNCWKKDIMSSLLRSPLFLALFGGSLGFLLGAGLFYHGDAPATQDILTFLPPIQSSLTESSSFPDFRSTQSSHVSVKRNDGPRLTITTPTHHRQDLLLPSARTIRASEPLFTSLPSDSSKTFFAHNSKMNWGITRALHALGWKRVSKPEQARLLYTYRRYSKWYTALEPWQRYNHIPETWHWNHKDKMATGFRDYAIRTTNSSRLFFLPETYDLSENAQRAEFQERLNQGGMHQPWVLKEPNVNQGRGITMLGPDSEGLANVMEMTGETNRKYVIQQFICNEMTWERRKYDVRMYWFVASVDPLIVLYTDGYVRIGNAEYSEENFNNTRNFLTTHTFLGEEGKASYDQFNDHILEHFTKNRHIDIQPSIDPREHVRNQFKHTLATLVDAFKDKTFQRKYMMMEDSFEFYGADFILDKDLNVWLIEAQDDTGMDEDHYFRLDMHHQIYYGMASTLEEIWDKQAKGEPIFPLTRTGAWEVIYADQGWKYQYEGYERPTQGKSCRIPRQVKSEPVATA